MKAPSCDAYINIIAGIEMINYFNPIEPIFTVSVYNTCDPNDAFFLTLFIFFSIAVILNLIKLLYEVNVQLIFSVHIFCLINECLNILLFVFICFYLTSANFAEFSPLDKTHHSHLPLMSIRRYLTVIISMAMICIPFKILSLISWSKYISKPFVKYMGTIFRMLPGVLVCLVVVFSIFYMFSLMNYALYNQYFYQYSSIENSFLALFNLQIIQELIAQTSRLYDAITVSPYYIFLNIFQLLIFLLLIIIFTGTFSYLFKRASKLEEDKMENEVMAKLAQIEEKLTQGKDSIDNDLKKLKKQILWLNLSHKNELYNQYSFKNELLLFKASHQVISFLKYLFAIKPELQFKNLYNKFGILIEVRNERASLKDSEQDQIASLVDWLMFVGCKIPVVLFSQMNLEKTIRMKFHATYRHITYSTDQNDLYNFIKVTSKENVCCHVEKFSYAVDNRNSRLNNTYNQNGSLSLNMNNAKGENNLNVSQQIYGNNNNSLAY